MPNTKSPLIVILGVGGLFLTLFFSMWAVLAGISGNFEAELDKAKLQIEKQAYPMTQGLVLENEVKNINKKLDKMDGNIEKILDKLE